MHDVLEGVCTYAMRLICRTLLKYNIDLHFLNSQMQSVNYGYYDLSSTPPVITSLESETKTETDNIKRRLANANQRQNCRATRLSTSHLEPHYCLSLIFEKKGNHDVR
jgi:hypothetical protein